MASLITVRLNKGDAPNWGFRLQGGKDFGTALVVQKVIGGSPAERAGLIAGDSVIKINTTDVFNLRHKDAQDVVVRAGPAFEMTIQRGGSTWKPHVVPTGSFPTPSPVINNFSPVTKTSLAAHQTENIGAIGTGHNLSAKPFNTQVNGAVNGNNPKVVNKQYNTPLKLYSEESIAETLSAQTEVLSTGALGVNFKKNEKNYDASNSAVFRMLQEAENDPRPNDSEPDSGIITAPNSGSIGLRHVQAPENRPAPPTPQLPPGQNICADCERLIVGVFVRIKDKNLHVECFKCATCGSSLKNVGYYNINQKLYCDIHAKLAARNNPPAPNLVPVTVQPGARVPANAISAALASHSIPAPLSPKPNNYAAPFQSAGNFGGAKPFSSVSAPLSPRNSSSTLPRSTAAPLSPVAPAYAPSFSPASSAGRSVNIVWPPVQEEPDFPTASPLYFPPPSQIQETLIQKKQQELEAQLEEEEYCQLVEEMAQYQQPTRMSEEMSCQKSQVECVETISESLETKQLVDHILKTRPMGPPPIDQDIRPTDIQNPQQNICCQRRESDLRRPTQFTPNTIECELKQPFVENTIPQKWESSMVQALRTAPDDAFHQIPTKRTSTKMGSALATAPAEPFTALPPFSLEPVPLPEETVPYFPPEHPITIEPKEPKPQAPDSQFVKALKIAPERPFTPAGEKPVKKKPNPTDKYLQDLPKPQEHLSMLSALTTAPDRAYTPLLVESMCVETKEAECKQTKTVDRSMLNRPIKPAILPASFQQNAKEPPPPRYYPRIMQQTEESRSEEQQEESSSSTESKTTQIKEVVEVNPGKAPVIMEIEGNRATPSNFPPIFQGFSCSFQNKTEHSQFSVEVNTTPPICTPEFSRTPVISASTESVPQVIKTQTITEESQHRASSAMKKESQQKTKVTEIEKQAEEVVMKKPLPAATLHKPESLPSYQVSLSESVEADLQMMKKMEAAQLRHEQQKVEKVSPKPPPAQTKPIITIQPGEGKPMAPQMSFQPVVDRPQSTTFSPRPRPLTPSMINKAPGALPYYQANLVATQQLAVRSSLLDPKSPNASRSPSPCPDRGQRASSPFPSGASRAKSPAPGPPENPLKSASPLPTPRDSKIEGAKKSLSTFIPQYKSKMDLIEARGMDFGSRREEDGSGESSQMYTSQVQLKTVPYDPRSGTSSFEMQKQSAADMQRSQMQVSQVGQSTVSTAISKKAHMEQMEQKKQSERRSVETSADGSIQVQRKKTVMEEYEHTQKENVIQIEKNVSCMKKHPFHDVNPPVVETHQEVVGMHITNPQPLASKFLQARLCENICAEASSTSCCQKGSQCAVPCDPPPTGAPIKHVTPPQPPTKHVTAPGSSKKPNQIVNRSTNVPLPNTGTGGGRQSGAIGVAPKRGRGILNVGAVGSRIAQCGQCHGQIRGPFITALGRIWCPEHFICATPSCRRPLQDMGFVEERGQLYCEYCFEQYLAPPCSKCNGKIKEDCLKAIGKNFHPECFNCVYCGKTFGNNAFFLEDGSPYCEADWNELFTTKCYACGFPVEAGDRWVEALNNNYHSQCFNCTMCKKNLEGQSFFAKGGRPFCKNHAR